MRCMICGKTFFTNRNISNVLRHQKYYVCPECYNAYPIMPNYQVLPVGKKMAFIYHLFDDFYKIDVEAFPMELSLYFCKILKSMDKGSILLILDRLLINDKNLCLLDIISNLNESNVTIISFFPPK